jgi:hypothetical protein
MRRIFFTGILKPNYHFNSIVSALKILLYSIYYLFPFFNSILQCRKVKTFQYTSCSWASSEKDLAMCCPACLKETNTQGQTTKEATTIASIILLRIHQQAHQLPPFANNRFMVLLIRVLEKNILVFDRMSSPRNYPFQIIIVHKVI